MIIKLERLLRSDEEFFQSILEDPVSKKFFFMQELSLEWLLWYLLESSTKSYKIMINDHIGGLIVIYFSEGRAFFGLYLKKRFRSGRVPAFVRILMAKLMLNKLKLGIVYGETRKGSSTFREMNKMLDRNLLKPDTVYLDGEYFKNSYQVVLYKIDLRALCEDIFKTTRVGKLLAAELLTGEDLSLNTDKWRRNRIRNDKL